MRAVPMGSDGFSGYDGTGGGGDALGCRPDHISGKKESMSEQLLQELEASAPVMGSLENIKDLVRVVVRDVGMAVAGMQGTARTFETCWRRLVVDVANGRTADIQAIRLQLLDACEKRLCL